MQTYSAIAKDNINISHVWDFPGSPVGKTPSLQCKDVSSALGQGTKIPPAMWCSQKKYKNKQT